ncbi:hypothetical protein ASG81_26560 [Paenibacillus sp. Soil522]|nr:hypothetical protein ASG81_26560 [Paenibacillus sp. Soil522]
MNSIEIVFGYKEHIVMTVEVIICFGSKGRLLQAGCQEQVRLNSFLAEHFEKQIEFELSDMFKERIKRRPIIEHKNTEMKRFHGVATVNYSVSSACGYKLTHRIRCKYITDGEARRAKAARPRLRMDCFIS